MVLNNLQKIENGLILESGVLNYNLHCRLLKRQSVHNYVRVGNLVYYNNSSNQWLISGNNIPQGVYAGNNIVILEGAIYNLENLPTGYVYMKSDGTLTSNINESFQKIKVGYASNDETLYLNIQLVGVLE